MELESRYLAGMIRNFEQAKGRLLRGRSWTLTETDEADRLRALMARHQKFDRQLLTSLSRNRRLILQGFQRPWWFFGQQRTGVAIASVLTPLEWQVQQASLAAPAPPIDRLTLQEHLRTLNITPHIPHIIGVLSPSGFTAEAREWLPEMRDITLVLIEPGSHGGWQVIRRPGQEDPRLRELFDPEDNDDKIERVANYVAEHRSELVTGGLTVSQLVERLQLEPKVVEQGLRRLTTREPEYQLGQEAGELFLYRGIADEGQERAGMSMIDRIRQLFSREGDETRKINELAERRAALSQRRDRLYDEIAQLEKREADLMTQGRENQSQVVRRRIAAQVSQLRQDIARQNAAAAVLNKQINILSTNIHNLALIQQGQKAKLPTTEELTETAVAAEEMLESLNADADLVGSLSTGINESLVSADEMAIMQEFEAPSLSNADKLKAAGVRESAVSPATGKDQVPPSRQPEAN
ncbi:MAG: hypothetical protein HJJLKODD_00344 [Phycisphaerae bacterium]|nr:hypothetical protein [Phycisphaerae bacterium]